MISRPSRTPLAPGFWTAILYCLLVAAPCHAQKHAKHSSDAAASNAAGGAISALMISDIHFDPFHDPSKASLLAQTPVSRWESVLTSPASPQQQQDFDALQKQCGARGVDTPWPLLRSALDAMRAQQPDPQFITLTGDLVAHALDCRFNALVHNAAPEAYASFVANTIQFVVDQLRSAYPGVPIYISLGNNDTPCGDYQLDPGSAFLARTATTIADALPESSRGEVAAQFPTGGYYSVTMAPPMLDTRIIVLNDLFLVPRYRSCAGADNPAPAATEIAWLGHQLAQAEQDGQNVWVIGHIPPGVDPYSTVKEFRNVCGGQSPVMFLSSTKIDDLLMQYSDIVRLGLFAHTHMDEMRLLAPPGAATAASATNAVPLKLVSSISPVDGNNPSFTVAQVDPVTAALRDYDVFVASNQTGIGTTWSEEYDYAAAYHEPAFSAAAVGDLIAQFQRDPKADTGLSQQYIRSYFKGDASRALTPFWPQYACALNNTTAQSYAACVCHK